MFMRISSITLKVAVIELYSDVSVPQAVPQVHLNINIETDIPLELSLPLSKANNLDRDEKMTSN